MLIHALQNSGVLALLSLIVVVVPLAMGLLYAVRPTEARLALMRPLSLASIFAALCGLSAGVINAVTGSASRGDGAFYPYLAIGLSEAVIPLFVGSGCLTVAWLCVAIGMRRQS